MILQNILSESAFLNDSSEVIDIRLWQTAKRRGKDLWGLETYEQEQAILEKLSVKWQVKTLLKTVGNMRNARSQARKAIKNYLKQDIEKLHAGAKKMSAKSRKWLIYSRNEAMAERFAELAAHSTLFAAVGAGHLSGGKGLLRLLKKQGAKIQPVELLT